MEPNSRLAAVLQLLSPAPLKAKDREAMSKLVVRLIFRRDFPSPGEASLAMLDLGCGLVGDWGVTIAKTGNESVQIREVYDLPRLPDWLLQLLLRFELKHFDYRSLFEATSVLTHQILEDECGFMVLALKQCCRGLPLLPSVAEDMATLEELSWIPQDSSSAFGLTTYLQHLLGLVGLDPEVIFDELDGRQVVPFQAVVNRALWHRLWQTLAPLFKKQRAAYRRYYGGSGAPQIQADVLPRFCSNEQTHLRGPLQWDGSASDNDELQVKNTFIQFTTDQCDFETSSSR
jgi:hypothetical protein